MRAPAVLIAAFALAGCGEPDRVKLSGVAPFGVGPGFKEGSLNERTERGAPVGGLACTAPGGRTRWVHIELFARGKVMIVPAGIGVAPPRERRGAYVRGGRCRYPIFTEEPTGLVGVRREGLTLGDLFRVWGRPLGPRRMAGFRGRVTVHVDGRRVTGDPADVLLRHHSQIVVQVGGPPVKPHAAYRFPSTHQ